MTPSLNHQCPKSRSHSIKGDQATACSLDSQDYDLSSGVPLWQSSVTPPCCLPHWLKQGGCVPLHPAYSVHLETRGGRRVKWGPCVLRERWKHVLIRCPVSHSGPDLCSHQHFRERGESWSLPQWTAAQWVPSTQAYLRHWGAVEQDIVRHPQVMESNGLLVQWEYPFWACRNNVWFSFFKEGHATKLFRFKTEASLFKILLYLWFIGHSHAFS